MKCIPVLFLIVVGQVVAHVFGRKYLVSMDFYEERDSVCDFHDDGSPDPTKTNSEIQQFFAGKTVLITGATGLVGSLLLEHILRLFPNIGNIYLLLREKKQKTKEERLSSLFESEEFLRVRKIHRNPADKITIIAGDISEPWCGISEKDRELIIENVDMVYHGAAALRMDEKLDVAYNMNVRATKHLLEIALKMKKLKAFVYISTAYSNEFLPDISEKIYDELPNGYTASQIKQLLESTKPKELAALTPKIVNVWRNTYSFTKAIAEIVTNEYADLIPVAVARPSIIVGCAKEPLTGWINNIYGPTGVSLAACSGLMHVWYGGLDKISDLIPADKVASAVIAASWQVAVAHQSGRSIKPPVYNIVSAPKAPLTWRDYMNGTAFYGNYYKVTGRRFIRPYNFHIENRLWYFKIKEWVYHFLFGLIMDQILKLKGKQPMLLKGYVKVHNFNMQLARYACSQWNYYQENLDRVWSEMSSLDKQLLNFDMTNYNWDLHHSRTIRSIVAYILKEDFSDLEETLQRYLRMLRIINFARVAIFSALCYLFWNRITSLCSALCIINI